MSNERNANALDRKLGARVRARRIELGISQEGLAEAIGVTFQQVQKYEKGINRIAASRLSDIAQALDWPVERFFGRPEHAWPEAPEDVLITSEGARLLKMFWDVRDARLRKAILEFVAAVADGMEPPAVAPKRTKSRQSQSS